MRDGEASNDYFARGIVRGSQLGTHVGIHTNNDFNQHFTRNFNPDYSVKKRILFAKEELSRKVFDDVVLNAYRKREMAKEKGTKDGKGHALFVADSGGRGNSGGGRAPRWTQQGQTG